MSTATETSVLHWFQLDAYEWQAVIGKPSAGDGVTFHMSYYSSCYRRGQWRLLIEVAGVMKTYILQTVHINGHRTLREMMHREVNCQIAMPGNSYIELANGTHAEIIGSMFYEKEQELHISSSGTIFYHDQGPKELEGEARMEAFFHKWISDMEAAGWIKGHPPIVQARLQASK